MNQYAYGFGNPLGFTDRLGTRPAQELCYEQRVVIDDHWTLVKICPSGGVLTPTPEPRKTKDPTRPEPRCKEGDGCKEPEPVCEPGDENCKQTTCDPATDPNCGSTACSADDPGCDADSKKRKVFTYEKDGKTNIFYEGRPDCGGYWDHYGRNWNATNEFMHDTGAAAAKFAFSVVWAAAEGYSPLALYLTGAGGAVAGTHYLGVAAGRVGAHAAVSVFGFYGGLALGTLAPAARDSLGSCNP